MDCRLLTPIFNEFDCIFQDTMKELFVNQCLCKDASLYFFVIKIDRGKIYYVDKAGCIKNVAWEEKQSANEAIDSYIVEKMSEKAYRLQTICDFLDYRVFWNFSSETVDYDRGGFFFRCVCEFLTDVFNQLLEEITSEEISQGLLRVVNTWTLRRHRLVQTCLQRAAMKTIQYLQKLYAPLNLSFIEQLSGEYYERSVCWSNMVLLLNDAVSNMNERDFVYYFDDKQFPAMTEGSMDLLPSNIRFIRKLLQITQQDLFLVLGEEAERRVFRAFGICKESFLKNMKLKFPYIAIYFRDHMQWDIWVNQTYIFSYRNGKYKIDNKVIPEVLNRMLRDYFDGCEGNYENVAEIIVHALEQKHGTMVTVMNNADALSQALRLGHKEFGLLNAYSKIKKDNIEQFSNIDGSVIMDTYGQICGIGMILDGSVGAEKGSLARGARYNSIIKYNEYLERLKIKAMTFIISEDGTLDIRSPKIKDY